MDQQTEIRYYRLHSGESVVAEVFHDNANTEGVLISYPIRVDLDIDMSGKPIMNMIEWIPIAMVKERKMVLKNADILMDLTPSDRMKSAYIGFTDRIKKAEGSRTNFIGQPSHEDDFSNMDEMQDGLGTLEELLESIRQKKQGRLH